MIAITTLPPTQSAKIATTRCRRPEVHEGAELECAGRQGDEGEQQCRQSQDLRRHPRAYARVLDRLII